MKLSQKQFDDFAKHYAWEVLKDPTLTVGEEFLRYFPAKFRRDELGVTLENLEFASLWTNPNQAEAWKVIRQLTERNTDQQQDC